MIDNKVKYVRVLEGGEWEYGTCDFEKKRHPKGTTDTQEKALKANGMFLAGQPSNKRS